jgi:hypothetical protein
MKAQGNFVKVITHQIWWSCHTHELDVSRHVNSIIETHNDGCEVLILNFHKIIYFGPVVRVPGYRSRGLGSILGATKFSVNGSATGFTQPREYN